MKVPGRHVGAYSDGPQHGASIQISINFLRITCLGKIAVTWILAKNFEYLPSSFSQTLEFIYWKVFDLYSDLAWMAWHWKPAISGRLWAFDSKSLYKIQHCMELYIRKVLKNRKRLVPSRYSLRGAGFAKYRFLNLHILQAAVLFLVQVEIISASSCIYVKR